MSNRYLFSILNTLILISGNTLFAETARPPVPTNAASKKYEEKLEMRFGGVKDSFKSAFDQLIHLKPNSTDTTRCSVEAYRQRETSGPNRRLVWSSSPRVDLSKMRQLKFRYSLQGINHDFGTTTTLAVQTTYFFETVVDAKPARVEVTCLQDKLFADARTCSQPERLSEVDRDQAAGLAARLAQRDPSVMSDLKAVYDRYNEYSKHRECIYSHLARIHDVDLMPQFESIGNAFFNNSKITVQSGSGSQPSASAQPPGRG